MNLQKTETGKDKKKEIKYERKGFHSSCRFYPGDC